MRIAFITPWPPQHTGIADYAFDLVSDLSKHDISIHVFSNCEKPVKMESVEVYNISRQDPRVLKNYDLIIYQMGNNIYFHLYMLNLIKDYPGIVHLHDMVLHHLMGWTTWMQGDPNAYFGLISKWYGEKVAFLCHEMIKLGAMPWNSPIVTDIPLFEEFVLRADACIVNSNFAKIKVKTAFPRLEVYHVFQVYKSMDIVEKNYTSEKQIIKVGVFGGIEPNKNVEGILEAFSKLDSQHSNWHLHIVGEVSDQCKQIPELSEKMGISDYITFHGRLDDEKFKKYLSEMDLIISLRFPTMGETSAVVMRAMQMGIPVIVTDVGWYAELPVFFDKVPAVTMCDSLLKLLSKYITENGYLTKKKQQFVEYCQKHLNVGESVNNYLKILRIEYSKKVNFIPLKIISDLIEDLNIGKSPILENTVKKLYDILLLN